MTVASPLHVRIPERRKPKHRRIYKALGFGLVAALLVPLTLGVALIGLAEGQSIAFEGVGGALRRVTVLQVTPMAVQAGA